MALLTLLDAQLAFGHVPLLDHADFALETGERVGLIGRNGAGKSSLLRILGGLESADDGQLQAQQSLRVAFVAQEPELAADATVFDAVAQSLAPLRALMDAYAAGLLVADKKNQDGFIQNLQAERYSSYDSGIGKDIDEGNVTLADLEAYSLDKPQSELIAATKSDHLESVKATINNYIIDALAEVE